MGLRREGFDKQGAPYEIREQGQECSEELKGMYDEFHPKAESQGLPPAKESDRISWVEHLLATGWNFLCRQEGKVVGHSAIIPDRIRSDGEYIVFVLQPYRNKGLGSALTEIGMEKARHEGLHVVWLTVEAFNFRAIRVYRKSGFRFVDEGNGERAMILQL
ncbi:MAG: GNAT family N-acetyltransferase [Thermodesulfobacteriota bacterium]